ncbi:MAG: chalcone isomerase family protein [Oleispira sp.]|nr:chalcone isomerase family protein [Oleispira sp.]MBL4882092.1 chalcone isomerase family protein [Oleispira sp.]
MIVSFSRVIYSLIFVIGINLYSDQVLALELKGAAIYQELGKDYYIASLYVTDSSQDALVLLADDKAQKMIIKVIAKRWSARKWKAQWQNNIAINNVVDADPKLAASIVSFTEFPLSSLRAGDELIIDYVPNIGTRIYFNSHPVVNTKNIKLYSYLLNTWLGKFSPNRIFRDSIAGLTVPKTELLIRADDVVSKDRIAEVSTWFVNKEEKIEEKNKARRQQELLVAAELSKKKNNELNKNKALVKKQSEQEAKQRRFILAQQKQDEALKRKQKKKSDAKNQQKLANKQKKKKQQDDLAMQAYYQKLYLWQLQSKINESVVYPPWAKQFSQQGPVELTFSTDRSTSLLNLVNKTPATSKILVQEVERRLSLALETITRPALLQGNSWSFSIHYLFSPAIKELAPLAKPKKP